MKTAFSNLCLFAVLFALAPCRHAAAQTLYYFTDDATGAPQCTLTETSPGTFYGASGTVSPTVFSITASGEFETVATVNAAQAGTFPRGQLFPASNGLLYGVTEDNGNNTLPVGSIYAVSLLGKVETLKTGLVDATPLVEASDGNLYGVALFSGGYTVFRLSFGGVMTAVANVGATPPAGALVQASDGNLYGATGVVKNASGYTPGFIYKVSLSGSYSILSTLPTNSGASTALTEASNGLLYGGAYVAVASGNQTKSFIYTVSTSGTFSMIKSIPQSAAQVPRFNFSLLEASDGFIYGTFVGRNGGGAYKMSLDGSTFDSLLNYSELPGSNPQGIAEGSDGNLYVVFSGEANQPPPPTYGVIYRLIDSPLPLPFPAPQYTVPASGSVGSAVLIYGSQLLGPTAVSFNGVPATKIVSRGQHYIYAVVPPGATTGPVTVNTPNGSGTTSGSFQVE